MCAWRRKKTLYFNPIHWNRRHVKGNFSLYSCIFLSGVEFCECLSVVVVVFSMHGFGIVKAYIIGLRLFYAHFVCTAIVVWEVISMYCTCVCVQMTIPAKLSVPFQLLANAFLFMIAQNIAQSCSPFAEFIAVTMNHFHLLRFMLQGSTLGEYTQINETCIHPMKLKQIFLIISVSDLDLIQMNPVFCVV